MSDSARSADATEQDPWSKPIKVLLLGTMVMAVYALGVSLWSLLGVL